MAVPLHIFIYFTGINFVLNEVKQKETFSEWIVSVFEHTVL
jgi:hypothetical protein